MATPKAKLFLPTPISGANLNTPGEIATSLLTSPIVNKGWRGLILVNRANSGMPKHEMDPKTKLADITNKHTATKGDFSLNQRLDEWTSKKHIAHELGIPGSEVVEMTSKNHTKVENGGNQIPENDIIIINSNVSPAIHLKIQNRPSELQVDPLSNWNTIKSIGRNNGYQVYTGGEDTLTFDVSWYSVTENNADRTDVITKCRLLESWSKADGYKKSPPTLRILWGKSGLFDKDYFVLVSANYKLSNFQNGAKIKSINQAWPIPNNYQILDLKLLPNVATQTLVFKRVTPNNYTHDNIMGAFNAKNIKGIENRYQYPNI